MSEVTIIVTAMGFRVPLTRDGLILGTMIHIGRFASKFEQWEFDRALNKDILINEYFYFDKKNNVVHFPRYALDDFKLYVAHGGARANVIYDEGVSGTPVNFLMLPHIEYKNDKQKNCVEFLVNPDSGPLRGVALQTGTGKAQALYSLIRTAGGWVRNGDLKLGQEISMPDGTTAPVIGIYPQGKVDIYRVTLDDGRYTDCSLDHLWKWYTHPQNEEYTTSTLAEIFEYLSYSKTDVFIPVTNETITVVTKIKFVSADFIGQHEAQCIMVDHPDHLYITDNYIVTHNTVSVVMALQKIARRSMITMTSRLEQWVKEMGVYTTLEEDDLYVIQGVASLTKLFDQIDTKVFPKVILASTKTIRLYLEYGEGYQHLPHPTDFCKALGVGVICSDEYHEHFNSNLMMMLAFNPQMFIPITATFNASSPYVKQIFNNFIPSKVQFTGGEYDRFVNATSYQYTGGSYQIKPYHYMRAKGYSQNKFEDFLLSKKGDSVLHALLNDAILPIINEHYIRIAEKGEKFLMICSSKEMCDYLAGVFKRTFRDKTVSVFYSGMPAHTLEKFDMILSTPGSAGTGRDIKGLRTCFAFENTGSEIRNLQFIGRLRGPPQMLNTPEFVTLYFACIPQHVTYNNSRAMLYGPKALHYKQRKIG
jgi:hypothetical protein